MTSNSYVIYSISNSPYQEWQAELLDYSFKKVKQPGTLIRLCSEDGRYPGRRVPLSRAGHTIGTPNFSRLTPEIDWPVMNKPGALKWFFEHTLFHDEDTLIFLDPDMIFTKAWNPAVTRGSVYGQKWKGYSKDYCQRTSVQPELCPTSDDECVMYPFAIKAGDMKRISGDIEYFSRKGHLKCDSWMADMSAFVTAMVKDGLSVQTEENIGLCNNWDNSDDEEAPIMHYCQPIKDKEGKGIWHKRKYKAWDAPPDSAAATNRVDREVLKMLHEHIATNPKRIKLNRISLVTTSLLRRCGLRRNV
jgi:hypothetical protein